MNARSSEPSEKDASVDASSATTGAPAEEEEVEDDGMTEALARSGVTALARIAGRTSVARGLGGIDLARTARRATKAFLLCRHRQEGMKTTTRTRGLGASRSRVQSPASWAALRPQTLSASSNRSLVR